jgi:hypothetical protein
VVCFTWPGIAPSDVRSSGKVFSAKLVLTFCARALINSEFWVFTRNSSALRSSARCVISMARASADAARSSTLASSALSCRLTSCNLTRSSSNGRCFLLELFELCNDLVGQLYCGQALGFDLRPGCLACFGVQHPGVRWRWQWQEPRCLPPNLTVDLEWLAAPVHEAARPWMSFWISIHVMASEMVVKLPPPRCLRTAASVGLWPKTIQFVGSPKNVVFGDGHGVL